MSFNTKIIRDVDIIMIAETLTDVIRKGNKYFVRCTHPGDNDASLCLYKETNTFYCFGCQAGKKAISKGSGNIEFYMFYTGCTYEEAVFKIAEIGSIKLDSRIIERNKEKESYLMKMAKDKDIFQNQLAEVPQALNYLYSRGLTKHDIIKHELGWVMFNNDEYLNHVGCISYPINNISGETIGFCFRNCSKEISNIESNQPKYSNSMNNSFFKKSSTFYGIDKVKELIKEKNYIIIGEGNHDAISCQKHDIPFISIMGTNLTDDHINLIRHYTENILFWFDGDSAGKKALNQAYLKTLNTGLNVKCIDITGFDPDQMINKLELQMLSKDQIEEAVIASSYDFSYQAVQASISNYLNTLAEAQRKLMNETKDIINKTKGTVDYLILLNLVNNVLNLNKDKVEEN